MRYLRNRLGEAAVIRDSNQDFEDYQVLCEFSGPWKIVENYGRFAHQTTAARLMRAAAGGEASHDVSLAGRVRFEPKPMIDKGNGLCCPVPAREGVVGSARDAAGAGKWRYLALR